MSEMRTKELFDWIRERHIIQSKKERGEAKPWTKDKILQAYRFCNVYRELDTTTQWIAKHWRAPHRDDDMLWFAMVVARLLNWPPSLETLGYPVPWNPKRFARFDSIGQEYKVFSGAYIVSTNGKQMAKIPYLMEYVLDPLWEKRKVISQVYRDKETTLRRFHELLMQFDGLGSFMAAQVVADLKYVKPLSQAKDWSSFAASGPGSRRGLNRVLGCPFDQSWNEHAWTVRLQLLHAEINKLVTRKQMPPIHAQDLQNCLCEFDKYERTRLGEGKPRNTYPGLPSNCEFPQQCERHPRKK